MKFVPFLLFGYEMGDMSIEKDRFASRAGMKGEKSKG